MGTDKRLSDVENDISGIIPNYIHKGIFNNLFNQADKKESYGKKQQVVFSRLDYIDRNPNLINPHFIITQSAMIPSLKKEKVAYIIMPEALLNLNINDILFHSQLLEYEGLRLIEKGYTLGFELYGDDSDYYGFVDVRYYQDKPDSFTLKYPKSGRSFQSASLKRIIDEILKRMHNQEIFNLDDFTSHAFSDLGSKMEQ